MALSAKADEKVYYSPEISDDFGKSNKFYCVGCKGEMVFHRNIAGVKIQHFAHKVACPFETEPETAEHIEMKKWCYENIIATKKYTPDSKMVGNQKPDVLMEKNGKLVAIECQCSKIGYDDWKKRTEAYSNKGTHVLWLFGGEYNQHKKGGYYGSYTSVVEREAGYLYFGRVYYVENREKGFAIIPKRLKMAHWWKVKRIILDGPEIKNHGLLLTSSGKYLIARFYDKKWWDS